MKDYCPECGQVMDETEFMQNGGICNNCMKKKGKLDGKKRGNKEKDIIKENNLKLSI